VTVTTETATRVLPFTGVTIPTEPVLTLTAVRTFRAIDGVGTEATLREGGPRGRIIGSIENEGTGGGTWFRPGAPGARAVWEAFVEACKTADPERFGSEFAREEAVADTLVDEVLLTRDANKKGHTTFRKSTDPWNPTDTETLQAVNWNAYPCASVKSADTPQVRAWAAKQGYDLVWADGAWQDNA
jgi:hypothetical protein